MRPETISFSDLMRECNMSDVADFMRVLKANQFQIRRDAPVPVNEANRIVQRLQNRKPDWYKYRQEARDDESGGPLLWCDDADICQRAADWFNLLPRSVMFSDTDSRLLGLVCIGGFLAESSNKPFVLPFTSGMNVLIGDRGSGKSTVLNLLGILSPGTGTTSGTLLQKMLSLLQDENADRTDHDRKIRQTLRSYGISYYSCFLRNNREILCFIVDVNGRRCALLERQGDKWLTRVSEGASSDVPQIQILQQGEVFKIADDSNRHYLNSLLDAIFPTVSAKRENFIKTARKLVAQFESWRAQGAARDEWPNRDIFDRFIDGRKREVAQLTRAMARQRFFPQDLDLLRGYRQHLDESATVKHKAPMQELLGGSNLSLWNVLFARRRREFRGEVEHLLKWAETMAAGGDAFEAVDLRKDVLSDDAFAEVVDESFNDDDDEEDTAGEAPVVEADYTLEPGDELGVLATLTNRIRERAARMEYLRKRWESRRPFTPIFAGLARSYSDFLFARIQLIEVQERCCAELETLLNRETRIYHVLTSSAQSVAAASESFAQALRAIPETDRHLRTVPADTKIGPVYRNLQSYIQTTDRLVEQCTQLTREFSANLFSFFDPIDVQLLQGSVFRSFDRLSFGQRSGIILKIVLGATRRPIIMIDQPEDNLDAHAVGTMLAPTLTSLSNDRQVVIATHNPNLVMGIPDARLVVLEARGETGAIRAIGKLVEKQLTEAVLDVLEGGRVAFQHKLKAYQDFLVRLAGSIRDMDIALIESTFRRRTIDGLRNFLQPVVSNEEMLRFYRHELRQAHLLFDVEEARRAILPDREREPGGSSDLLGKLDRVLQSLVVHVELFQKKIQDLAMLDTQPQHEELELGSLVHALAEEVRNRVKAPRIITVTQDPALDGVTVFADRRHLKLIFDNLFNNSLRATEHRGIETFTIGSPVMEERINLSLVRDDGVNVTVRMRDNGCGIPSELQQKLYREKCSNQFGGDHGLGGIIICKLLELNRGAISVVSSSRTEGTVQDIQLTRRVENA